MIETRDKRQIIEQGCRYKTPDEQRKKKDQDVLPARSIILPLWVPGVSRYLGRGANNRPLCKKVPGVWCASALSFPSLGR